MMKAISVKQPWASAIACGAKRIETRHWATSYRGPLLIHAAKRRNLQELYSLTDERTWRSVADADGSDYDIYAWMIHLPYGALIAVAELVDCVRVGKQFPATERMEIQRLVTEQERALGDFTPGRFGWVLANVRALPTPIPYRGRQGLFDVPAELLPVELRGAA